MITTPYTQPSSTVSSVKEASATGMAVWSWEGAVDGEEEAIGIPGPGWTRLGWATIYSICPVLSSG